MEHPHASQHDTSHICPVHHDKADAHEDGHRHHDPHLGFPRHAFALDVAFQVVLVEPGAGESGVKLFGAFAKAEGCQQQKRERRKQRQYGTQSTQSHADAAQCDVQDFLDVHVVFFNRLFSFLVSIT